MSFEDVKRDSRRLRGALAQDLQTDSSHFQEENVQLLKFHGSYQQDDRDQRVERRKQKQDKAYIFMVRSKIPGGMLTAEQYLTHDRVAGKYGNGTLRITSRQDLQTHFVLKGDLKECIATINRSGITTWGACGDVVRNVVASPIPIDSPVRRDIWRLARELKDVFTARSRAYSEIWLDGEKIDTGGELEEEPIYGDAYLPRKFKFGIAVPPRNDIDVYANDCGLVPFAKNGEVEGYTFLVGGGFGMSHGNRKTYPALAKPLFYVKRPYVIEACKAIVLAQRDHGDRSDRKHARLKYLIYERGVDWFRQEVLTRMDPRAEVSEAKPLLWTTVSDMMGWNEQGDGRLFLCVWVPDGRIKDAESVQYRAAFRILAEKYGFPIRLTSNCNIIFHDIPPALKDEVDQVLRDHRVPDSTHMTEARRLGMACVALPTCGLALAESERVFQEILDQIDVHLRELRLENEPLLIRMTGCPNGCARPYNADIAFVGKSHGKYVIFVGGSHRGDRMAAVDQKMVLLDDIPRVVRGYLEEFAQHRQPGESFTDYWGRTRHRSSDARPEQFHAVIEESAVS